MLLMLLIYIYIYIIWWFPIHTKVTPGKSSIGSVQAPGVWLRGFGQARPLAAFRVLLGGRWGPMDLPVDLPSTLW